LLLYYITDRKRFPGDETERRRALLDKIAEAARQGVNFIQLREKDLTGAELESLARRAAKIIKDSSFLDKGKVRHTTRLLINSRSDVAIACGADGVHLPGNDLSPHDVREIWGRNSNPIVSVATHSADDVEKARARGGDYAIFAPVFEKKGDPSSHPSGLVGLRQACRAKIPVLALGGITLANAPACCEAGAAGIAAIGLFQENDVAEVIAKLRQL
jgi:thiamine-phosphate pyrophosphorylase